MSGWRQSYNPLEEQGSHKGSSSRTAAALAPNPSSSVMFLVGLLISFVRPYSDVNLLTTSQPMLPWWPQNFHVHVWTIQRFTSKTVVRPFCFLWQGIGGKKWNWKWTCDSGQFPASKRKQRPPDITQHLDRKRSPRFNLSAGNRACSRKSTHSSLPHELLTAMTLYRIVYQRSRQVQRLIQPFVLLTVPKNPQ